MLCTIIEKHKKRKHPYLSQGVNEDSVQKVKFWLKLGKCMVFWPGRKESKKRIRICRGKERRKNLPHSEHKKGSCPGLLNESSRSSMSTFFSLPPFSLLIVPSVVLNLHCIFSPSQLSLLFRVLIDYFYHNYPYRQHHH